MNQARLVKRTILTTRLYRQFVRRGDLAFDIGAHVGARTKALLLAGARVLAVEPQPQYAALISKRATVELSAVGAKSGQATLRLAKSAPELATLSDDWVRTIGTRYPEHPYTNEISVPVTTLDELISRHGQPVFCKIDTEGYDAEVVAGLSIPLAAVAFEVTREALAVPFGVIDRLTELASYEFAYSEGVSMRLGEWMSPGEAKLSCEALPVLGFGDLYARRTR